MAAQDTVDGDGYLSLKVSVPYFSEGPKPERL